MLTPQLRVTFSSAHVQKRTNLLHHSPGPCNFFRRFVYYFINLLEPQSFTSLEHIPDSALKTGNWQLAAGNGLFRSKSHPDNVQRSPISARQLLSISGSHYQLKGGLYVQSATRLHNHNSGLSNHFRRLRRRKLEPKCQLEFEPDQWFNRNWNRNWRYPHSDSDSNSHAYPGTIVVHGSPDGYGEQHISGFLWRAVHQRQQYASYDAPPGWSGPGQRHSSHGYDGQLQSQWQVCAAFHRHVEYNPGVLRCRRHLALQLVQLHGTGCRRPSRKPYKVSSCEWRPRRQVRLILDLLDPCRLRPHTRYGVDTARSER